jgi:hypothetical protein
MSSMVPIAMFGWIPAAVALFWFLPARRAVLVGILAAWMFLPIADYPIAGWPDYTKMSATCGVLLFAVVAFDFRRVVSLRPAWIDAPIALSCLFPFASAVVNGLGTHEGFSVVFAQGITWAAPYLVGRIYFNDLDGLGDLAIGIFMGGLLYVPFCLFEVWNGPILHRVVYGYTQQKIDLETRFGILRPMVFMDSALMLAMWMTTASVLGMWLWKSSTAKLPHSARLGWLVPAPILATILIRAVNGWVLMALGTIILGLSAVTRSRWWLAAILALVPAYVVARASGFWSGDQLVALAAAIDPSRGHSMLFRLYNENRVIAHLHGHVWFGYGRQAAALTDDDGLFITSDSLWIITVALFGVAGLVSWLASLLVPLVAFTRQVPARDWFDGDVGPAAGLAVVLTLSTIDCLANAMINPIFTMIAGGLAGYSLTRTTRQRLAPAALNRPRVPASHSPSIACR